VIRVERDEIRAQLSIVRHRRQEAIRDERDLARQQGELEGRLAEWRRDPSGAAAASREAAKARVEHDYGPTRSPSDLTQAIHAWRRHMRPVTSLSVDVDSDRDHLRGDPTAPLVVVEYGDYECPECAAAHALYANVTPWLDSGRLCVVFRHFPLVDAHPLALRAAQAAEAAGAQGRFWEMHDVLMGLASDRRGGGRTPAEEPRHTLELERAARRAGLDLERFRAEIDDPSALERVLEDFRGGLASGVNGTPTFYVNGQRANVTGVEELYAQIAASIAVG
jgi:protein-disulfide isomerase